MGWSSDWLYRLLLDRAREAFDEAIRAARKREEPLPIQLLATEHANFHQASNMTCGDPVRAWSSEDDFASLVTPSQWPPQNEPPSAPTQTIYRVPMLSWIILPNRKQVLICRWIGPRYASGAWWDVHGQNANGRLVLANRDRWVS